MGKVELDEFHYHEAFYRVYCVQCLIEDILEDHPVIVNHKEFKKRVKKVQGLLGELYVGIGSMECSLFLKEKGS